MVLQHGHAVSLARFASRVDDDAQLLSVADKRVFFWTDKDHHAERAHDDAVVDAAVSGDGELIVSASADGTARVWSTRSGTPVAVLRGHKSELTRAFFGANLGQDRSLLTAGTDNSLRVWRLRPPTLLAAQPGWIRGLAVDRSGQQLALCGDMGAPGSSGAKAKAEPGVPLCRLMPPTDLAGRTKDDPVVVSGPANTSPLASASLSADGQWLIGQPADGLGKPRALLWPLRPQVGTALTPAWLNGVSGAVFSRDAAVLATLNEGAKDGGAITLWDAATLSVSAANPPNVVARFAARPERSVLAVSPDGRWIAASEGKRVTLLDARASSTAPRILGAHLGDVRALAFSRDSQALVSAGSDRMALVWPVAATGPPAKPVRLAGGHTAALSSAAFSPDGKQVVTASSDNSIRVWNAASGHELAALRRHGDAVNLVAFAPSGNAILSVSDDGTAKLGDCAACNTALDDLRAQVGQRIDLDPVDKIAFAAESRPWLPWLRWPSAKR